MRPHWIAVLVLAGLLAGCSSFRLGEPYDKSIEDDLNTFQKSAIAFITTMQLNAASAKGAYDSDAAKTYYATETALLTNLQTRADLLSDRPCPIGKVGALVAGLPGPSSDKAIHDAELKAGLVAAAATGPALDTSGNCISIVVRGVRLAEMDLQLDHMEKGKISSTVAELGIEEINAAVRVALQAIRSRNV